MRLAALLCLLWTKESARNQSVGQALQELKKSWLPRQTIAAKAYTTISKTLDWLRQVVSEGFVKLHTELDKLIFELKTEINAVKLSIKDIEKSLTYAQSEVEDLKERFEMETKEHSK